MNWIKKTLSFSEKIKDQLQNVLLSKKWQTQNGCHHAVTSSPILKASIFNDEQVNTCPNCSKHYPLKPRARFDHFYGKNNWTEIDTPQIPDDPLVLAW